MDTCINDVYADLFAVFDAKKIMTKTGVSTVHLGIQN